MNSPGKKCILLFSSNSVLRRKSKARVAEQLSVYCITTNLFRSTWSTKKKAISAHNVYLKNKKMQRSQEAVSYCIMQVREINQPKGIACVFVEETNINQKNKSLACV